jgi:hypothetical protein
MRSPLKILFFQMLSLLLVVAAGAASIPGTGAETFGNPEKRPLLNGTFIQLLEQNGRWNHARWERQFDYFKAIGLQQVVIQWTLHDNRAFFATQTFEQAPLLPLETILELAEARGIELYLGLAAESRYWDMIKQIPVYQEEYLNRLRMKSERVAQEVAAIATQYKAFRGWYIPEEIDDLTWRSPKTRKLLHQHLKQLSGFLKKLTPDGKVLLSGFSNSRMSPDSYGAFWNALLKETSVDILLFQDGTGTAKLTSDLLPSYLKAVRRATDANGKKLQVVVELFTVVSEFPFKAVPAPILRVTQQLRIADDYATGGINSFSVPDYMSLEGGDAAMELLHNYQEYKKGGGHSPPLIVHP